MGEDSPSCPTLTVFAERKQGHGIGKTAAYRPGEKIANADGLSLPDTPKEALQKWHPAEQIRKWTDRDPLLSRVRFVRRCISTI